MRQYAPEPRTYELMTIISPDVTEENIPSVVESVGGYITSAGGELQETLSDSPWGRRRLAYPIRHGGRDLRDGFYTLYHFLMQPSSVGEIERELKLNTDVIRYLVTRYEPVPVKELTPEEAEIAAEEEAASAYAAAQASSEGTTEASSTADSDADAKTNEPTAQAEAAEVPTADSAPEGDQPVANSEVEAGGDDAAGPAAPEATAEADEATSPATEDSDSEEEGIDESAKES